MARVRPEIRAAVVEVLDRDAARVFIAQLIWELTLGARGQYGPEGTMPAGSEVLLRCFNELIHRSTAQLRQALGSTGSGYPPDAFVDVVEAEASRNGLLEELEADMVRALAKVRGVS